MKIKFVISEYDEYCWFFGTSPNGVGYVSNFGIIHPNSYDPNDLKIEHKILKRLKYEN